MGFVRTRDEIARIQKLLTDIEFRGGRYIGVEFESEPDFIESVLPPGLEPRGNNIMTAAIFDFEGGSAGPFTGAAIYVAARHGDILGKYTMCMFMNNDNAMMFGRDIFGEPKRLAYVAFNANEKQGGGHVDRGTARLIEIDATFDNDLSLDPAVDIDFNYKASLAPDGVGLAGDAILTFSELSMAPMTFRSGTANLAFNGTVHDPLHEIPVKKIVGAHYLHSNFGAKCRELARIPGDDFLPYAYGRYPDWSVLADANHAETAGTRPISEVLVGSDSVR
ncbi:acetoacetate decarboxylase family protein [Novosphingobium pentaromativorans]|nr:acetoacetate decarboxylase family protein [Novosphingobium pentaromativorans]